MSANSFNSWQTKPRTQCRNSELRVCEHTFSTSYASFLQSEIIADGIGLYFQKTYRVVNCINRSSCSRKANFLFVELARLRREQPLLTLPGTTLHCGAGWQRSNDLTHSFRCLYALPTANSYRLHSHSGLTFQLTQAPSCGFHMNLLGIALFLARQLQILVSRSLCHSLQIRKETARHYSVTIQRRLTLHVRGQQQYVPSADDNLLSVYQAASKHQVIIYLSLCIGFSLALKQCVSTDDFP